MLNDANAKHTNGNDLQQSLYLQECTDYNAL